MLASRNKTTQHIFIATSAGNEGSISPIQNGNSWVLTVAAGTMDQKFSANLKLEDGNITTGSAIYTRDFPASTQFPIVLSVGQCKYIDELNKIGRGKIVMCDSSARLFDQMENVCRATVVGAIFLTNIMELEDYLPTSFPAIFINLNDGKFIKNYIKTTERPKASLELKLTVLGTKPAPKITSYSTRGPSIVCPYVLKPDIMAPGTLILAAWPPNISVLPPLVVYNKFNLMSGTSMACPQAAGVAALLKSVHPDWSPSAIQSAMITTTYTNDNTKNPFKGLGDDNLLQPESPLAYGSGHMDPNKALHPGLIYNASVDDYINLLCGLNYTKSQIKVIIRLNHVIKDCSMASLNLNYPSFIAFFKANDL
ncbi:subtilisin-like protease SBT3 [Rutidosis leptorrhynchoides]|uniref:subtilisin-like protease SBT3 n=1 Tax=Rutidosis leptorrhynchoides TaxID=125765 RepID=UPI003A996E48